jgi:hypothetical protein
MEVFPTEFERSKTGNSTRRRSMGNVRMEATRDGGAQSWDDLYLCAHIHSPRETSRSSVTSPGTITQSTMRSALPGLRDFQDLSVTGYWLEA